MNRTNGSLIEGPVNVEFASFEVLKPRFSLDSNELSNLTKVESILALPESNLRP